ncbi:MAG: PDZ domain-containing protein, partial [Alcaligenaceae bacterium]|nr:PDZ domain-containing protein [Alcaligenaceae bacterium]
LAATKPSTKEPADKIAETDRLGLAVTQLSDSEKEALGLDSGVVVVNVQGAAVEAGLMVDDIILALNDQDIKSVKDYQDLVKSLPKNKNAALLIRRDDLTQWVAVQPEK